MTEEPYRWLEAVQNRREYVREQLKGGSPVFAASLPDGILLLGVGSGRSKVFELFDRHALAGLGHPADIEKIRQAAIDAAHLEAFTRAPEDVSLRRLVSFGLGPQLKSNFEQIYAAPFLVELLLAELGATPANDLFIRVHFDGAFTLDHGGAHVAASTSEPESTAKAWLATSLAGKTSRAEVADVLLQAWWILTESKSFGDGVPSEEQRREGWKKASAGKSVEVGWLARKAERSARFNSLAIAELGLS
jgi:proteasome alpha subunit